MLSTTVQIFAFYQYQAPDETIPKITSVRKFIKKGANRLVEKQMHA
ncbi:MAG: hypothetical protein RLZZ71_1073 [Bacteroidota bacterium]|jgi:hypothetical protein